MTAARSIPRSAGRRRAPSRAERDLAWAVVGASALVAAFSAGEPAGWLPVDIVWRAGFGALVALATARAHRWTWLVMAGVAAAVAAGAWQVVAVGALVAAIAGAATLRRLRPLGALVGALSAQALLRLDIDEPGLSAVVVALAVTPALLSAYRRARSRTRRGIQVALLVAAGAAVVATAGLAVAVVQVQSDVREAAETVRDGLDAVRDNEPERAVALLGAAAADFDASKRSIAILGLPARLVPVLGHQARALAVLTGEGEALASTAARATVDADLDELEFRDGVLDLDLVAGFAGPLEDAYEALARAEDEVAQARTLWLVDPLSTGVADFADEVDRALPDAELAIEGVRVAPALFGGEGDRHYVIAFVQPAESRGLGGFIGNYGELSAVDGDVELTRSGRIGELIRAPGAAERTLSGPPDYLARYGRFQPAQFLQDLTFSPDGPTVAGVLEELYPQAGGRPVDGTIIVDPYALAALMEFTGPIQVPGLATPLTSENAADILVREQYLTFQDDEDQRVDFLDDATRITFERLTEGDLPGPRQVADVLGPLVREGRLIVHSVEDDEQALMERTGLDGALPPVAGDFLSVVTQNTANNKIDIFLQRSVRYRATWDPATGRVDGTVTVDLHNTAPAEGLPRAVIGSRDDERFPPGTNYLFFSLYTPHRLQAARLEGTPVGVEAQQELGRWVYSTFVEIPAGATVRLEVDLQGDLGPGLRYRLDVAPQPLVNADAYRFRVTPDDAWAVTDVDGFVVGDAGASADLATFEDFTLTATVLAD